MDDVTRIDGSRLVRIKLSRSPPKEVESEDDEPAVDVGFGMLQTTNDRVLLGEAASPQRLAIQSFDRVGGKRITRVYGLGFDSAAH